MGKNPIDYNSAYISINLLDELDLNIGGYSKPNIEFLFSLNTFVESFIASSSFYTSLDELNHLNLTAPALFPNGRPILNMLVKSGGLKFVNGIIDKTSKEIYKAESYGLTRKEAQQNFIIQHGKEINKKYLIKSDIESNISEIPLISFKNTDGFFTVSEIQTKPEELISNLVGVTNSSSIQTSLPIFLYKEQIKTLFKSPYSIETLDKLAEIHEENLSGLVKTLNFKHLPIPPFTNILLDQVMSVSEIPEKLTQLRNDFQVLRERFVELEKEIFEAENLKKQRDAYNGFIAFWGTFINKYSNPRSRIFYGIIDLAKNAETDQAINGYLGSGDVISALKDLNLGKLSGKFLLDIYEYIRNRKVINRFKGITNIWELFQSGKGIEEQLRHFERLFGVSYSNSEINRIHNIVKNKFIKTTIINS